MKILSGYQPADSGDIVLNGQRAAYHRPEAAIAAGIGMLQQDPLDVPPSRCWRIWSTGSRGRIAVQPPQRAKAVRRTVRALRLRARPGNADLVLEHREAPAVGDRPAARAGDQDADPRRADDRNFGGAEDAAVRHAARAGEERRHERPAGFAQAGGRDRAVRRSGGAARRAIGRHSAKCPRPKANW